jgi:hypothetical protein
MKYVCYKKVLSKIAEQDVKDPEDIKSILKVIKEQELSCSIRILDNDKITSFKEIRISSIDEDSFAYLVITPSSQLKKKSKFTDVDFLELIVVDAILAYLKPGTDRWSLIESVDLDT